MADPEAPEPQPDTPDVEPGTVETPPNEDSLPPPGVRMDGIGCLAIVGMILCGTIFLAPLGVLILAICLIWFIVQFIRRRLAGGLQGQCPACQAPITVEGELTQYRCQACQVELRVQDGVLQRIETPPPAS